jgi:hypothetical protein
MSRRLTVSGNRPRLLATALALLGLALAACSGDDAGTGPLDPSTDDPSPPAGVVKLVFIHHSVGSNWLSDGNGGLGLALRDNHYYVSDTNYGWGPDTIGDRTDIPDWPDWFCGANAPTFLAALYAESGQHTNYTRLATDPGGENTIVLFKSCYPNSNLSGSPADGPTATPGYTVGHAKYVYNTLLTYFGQHPEKLFVVITAPPVADATYAANARAFNEWLVNDWLTQNGYTAGNVAVYDFYNVLTSNGGDPDTNDLGASTGHHHRWRADALRHESAGGADIAAYAAGGDDHPSRAGSLKATGEFVPVLNVFYHRWQATLAARRR